MLTTFTLFEYKFNFTFDSTGTPYITSFIFILWIRTGLQNPYGYGNSQIYLLN